MRPGIISLIAFVLGAGCSGISVSHDYDPRQDFTSLKRWSWARPMQTPNSKSSEVSALTYDRIRRAIEEDLISKGYQEVDSDPDFVVQSYAGVGQRFEVAPGYGPGWYGNGVQVYDEGTLVIDILLAREKRLIWRGTAQSAVESDPNMDPAERDARIREAVKKILADFPPKLSK